MYTVSAALPAMLARKSGHLVAVSSLAAYRGLPAESAYCASKAAVNVYMDGLRMHLHGTGVRVTTICPGFVKTPMTETNKFYMPQLMEPGYAARQDDSRPSRAGTKVYNFPWRLHALIKPQPVAARTGRHEPGHGRLRRRGEAGRRGPAEGGTAAA